MKNKRKDYDNTNNRTYYNKLRKYYLEVDGEIRCSYCKYNKGENNKRKFYGGFDDYYLRFPSWKLTSKNKKQWMFKHKYHITTTTRIGGTLEEYKIHEITW
jgi:hypothetical protein